MVWTRLGRAASSCTAYRITETFSSSEGWNWSGPAPSQRVAPFTVTPKPGTITSTVSPKELMRSSGVMPLITLKSVARGEVHQHQPEQPQHHVAL